MKNSLAYKLSEAMSAFCRKNINRKPNLPIHSSEMGALIYITLKAGKKGVRHIKSNEYFGIKKSSVSSMIVSLEKRVYKTHHIGK